MPNLRNISRAIKNTIRALLPKRYLLRRDLRRQLERGEPELRIVRHLCSSTEISVDVGANLGIYSYLFSQYSQSVIAVEPNPKLAARLQRILPASVSVHNFAASNEDGVSEFYIPIFKGTEVHACASLELESSRGLLRSTIRVEKRRLDTLQFNDRPVAVIKIDVEGHELSTLQGLTGIIERSKPTIIVESEARHHSGAPMNVFEFLLSFDYRGYFIYRDTLRAISEFSLQEFQAEAFAKLPDTDRSPEYINNFIFVHPDRSSVLDGIGRVFVRRAPTLMT